MFKIKFDVKNSMEKHIINPEDLLPKKVETTDGKISPFDYLQSVKINITGINSKGGKYSLYIVILKSFKIKDITGTTM